jgi:phenylacetic acid degradation operon negative regulatory protein
VTPARDDVRRSARTVPPGAPAVPLTLSRRHADGAPSARGLLVTVLGELVLPGGGSAWTSAVLDVAARLEIEEHAARQALTRLAAAGWLTRERAGRRTRWALTASATALLTSGAERIYSFGGPATSWDGRWLVVVTRIPERDRRARHRVRSRLTWAGFGSLGAGLWVSPQPDRADEAAAVLRDSGAEGEAQVFVATRVGPGDVRGMVAAAWDLAALEKAYAAFLAQFRSVRASDPLARQVALVHAWRRFPAMDPGLPRELLPARWSGTRAAQLFGDRHERWRRPAQQEWLRLNAD